MSRRILLALMLLLLVQAIPALGAALQGLPLSQKYTPRDHQGSAANVDVLAHPDGVVFVANDRGLLRFDGGQWDRLELPGQTAARAIAIDGKGQLFVGGYDRFGRAEIDPTGAMRFVDLTAELRPSADAPPVGQVWSMCSTGAGLYVYSDSVLALFESNGGRRHWPVNEDTRSPFCTSTGVYARIHGIGLSRLAESGFELVAGGEIFASAPLYQVFEAERGALAVGDQAFYRIDDGGLHLLADTDGDRFADYPPYAGTRLADGSYVFGTYAGELLHFSAELRLLTAQSITRSTIFELAADAEGGLWVASESDLQRLRFPSAWSLYSSELGMVGQAFDTAHYRGDLYVATSLGVLRARNADGTGQLERVVETHLEASALEADPAGLLIADRSGVLLLEDPAEPASRLHESNAPFALHRSSIHPDRVYAPATQTMDLLDRSSGRWRHAGAVTLGDLSINGMEEDDEGWLWLGDTRGAPLRLLIADDGTVAQRQSFGSEQGLHIDPAFGSYVLKLDDGIHVISGRRVQRFVDGRFSEIDAAPFNQFAEPSGMGIASTAVGVFAYDNSRLLHRRQTGQPWRSLLSGTALAGGYYAPHLDADGLVRVVAWDGLLQYDPDQPEAELGELGVRMRSISLRVDDEESQRLPLKPDATPVFPAGATVGFDFGMATSEPALQYRLRVRGMFDEYSSWGPVAKPALNLRVPGPGNYVVEVEGRTPSGRTATPLSYAFRVEPRWWQRTETRVVGALVGIAAMLGLASLALRLRYRRYAQANRELEARIAERTAELETANRKLAELATEDELTGIANRRALDQALAREWDRCLQLQQSLAVVIFDVDHFKAYNDRLGHLAGDQHLVRMAHVLRKHAQPMRELLARFGGEEFVLVMPGADPAAACVRAEAMRADVEQSLPGTTVSAGVAAEVPAMGGAGPNAILQRADTALYRAKNSGRNRVIVDD